MTARRSGFTLIEVVVALLVGTLVMGGVFGLLGSTFNLASRVRAKAERQPVLEAAFLEILADPRKALQGSVAVPGMKGAPRVEVRAVVVPRDVAGETGLSTDRRPELVRLRLLYQGAVLETSLMVAPPEERDGSGGAAPRAGSTGNRARRAPARSQGAAP